MFVFTFLIFFFFVILRLNLSRMTPSAFQSQYQNLSPVQSKTLLGFLQPNPVLAFHPT